MTIIFPCTNGLIVFDFGDAANAGLTVIADQSEGEYSLVVSEAGDLLPGFSSNIQVTANPSVGMDLKIKDQSGLFAELGADEIEIWIAMAVQQATRRNPRDIRVVRNHW